MYNRVGIPFAIGIVVLSIIGAGYLLWPALEWLAKAAGWV